MERKRSTRYYSRKQETKVSSKLNIRTTPNSGATTFAKGDCRDKYLVLECKTVTTQQKSITIKEEWFLKTKEEAFSTGRPLSGLVVNFGPGTKNYVMLEIDDFDNLYQAWKDVNEE